MNEIDLTKTNQNLSSFVNQDNEEVKAKFIRKTYLHLAGGILLFILLEILFLNTEWIVGFGISVFHGWWWLLMMIGILSITSASEAWATNSTSRWIQYLALVIFVIAEALLFVPMIVVAMNITGDDSLVRHAAFLSLFLFSGISGVVLLTKKNFSILRNFLMISGMLALGFIILGLIFKFTIGLWFSFAMVGIAGGSILYQTSNILYKYNTEQYVAASLGLLGAILLLFWYILDILSYFSGD